MDTIHIFIFGYFGAFGPTLPHGLVLISSPHQVPPKWRINANMIIPELLSVLTKTIHSLSREHIYFVTAEMQFFIKWDEISANELFDYNGTDQDVFYDIYVEHPKLVKVIKDLIKGTYGRNWITEDLREFVNKINLFEDDSDYLLRFTTDGHHPASHWYEIDLSNCWHHYTFINEEQHLAFLGMPFWPFGPKGPLILTLS